MPAFCVGTKMWSVSGSTATECAPVDVAMRRDQRAVAVGDDDHGAARVIRARGIEAVGGGVVPHFVAAAEAGIVLIVAPVVALIVRISAAFALQPRNSVSFWPSAVPFGLQFAHRERLGDGERVRIDQIDFAAGIRDRRRQGMMKSFCAGSHVGCSAPPLAVVNAIAADRCIRRVVE